MPAIGRIIAATKADVRRADRISDFGYNPISGGSQMMDYLNPVSQIEMIHDSMTMWLKNPLANSIIELFHDFVWGDGITFTAKNDKVYDVLTKFWGDPDNDWEGRGGDRIRDLSLLGELILKPYVGAAAGATKFGVIFPGAVSGVSRSENNPEMMQSIRVGEQDLKIISPNPQTGMLEGDVFYFAVNKTTFQSRGLSDLFSSRDWLQLYDKSLYATMERVGLLLSFIWDVSIKGATPAQLKEKFDQIRKNPPLPGGFRVHSDVETWEEKTPSLNGRDFEDVFRLLKSQVIAGSRSPEHYFGMGGEVNFATASAMGVPFFKKVKRRQRYVKHILGQLFDYVLQQRIQRGTLRVAPEELDFEIHTNEPDPGMAANTADTLLKFSQALLILETNGILDAQAAKAIIKSIVSSFGVDIETEAPAAIDPKLENAYNQITASYRRRRAAIKK